jgi:hypothetical protein
MSVKYYATCECCNFNALSKRHWIAHIETQKHNRNGKKRSELNVCDTCGYWCMYHYNMDIHKIIKHGTKEQRKSSPYYCKYCDMAFFSTLFEKKHFLSKKHIHNQNAYENNPFADIDDMLVDKDYMAYINYLDDKIKN